MKNKVPYQAIAILSGVLLFIWIPAVKGAYNYKVAFGITIGSLLGGYLAEKVVAEFKKNKAK